MILRKPYAFFIKMFKPIHLVLDALIGYLLFLENNMFSFLDKNMYTSLDYVGQSISNKYVSNYVYIIPIIVILAFLGIIAIMYYKKKPILFYIVGIFSLITVLVINIYSVNFFKLLETEIISIKNVKLIHDLVFISMFIEVVLLVSLLVRGVGVNIKKFNFDSDISKIDIMDSDNEEFEVNIELDVDRARRERNKRIRYLKYIYAEKKLTINIFSAITLAIIIVLIFVILNNKETIYNERQFVSTSTCNISVDNSYLVDKSYDGKVITGNVLVVVNLKTKLNYTNSSVYLNDFNIKIGDIVYTPTTMYNKYLIDLGKGYIDKSATTEESNYLFVYEIPKELAKDKIIFSYNDGEKIKKIKLNPTSIDHNIEETNKNINDLLEFDNKLEGIKLTINSYDINDKYALKYNFCVKDNDCINSTEYIMPSLNRNYDKSIIKLDLNYEVSDNSQFKKFFDLLSTYGYIEYKINDKVKIEKNIEEITSTKLIQKNVIYLGVNSEIMNAEEVSFVFNIRDKKYVYKVK